ncbi:hypothetical protein EKN94_18405 [Enterobacter quasimori]|uniref:Uncharacterized protein n=1 Tax=Enterobacter quasimori TaxID=2838947 RepID=A0ABY0ANV1_9ENTR|nr:hypothetical protein [Enterobacter quasimori]RTN21487.1 hypothetical protein EKN94_18405 [Enterobacter quasimori]
MAQEKEISIGITFKEISLNVSDDEFKALLEQTIDNFKNKIESLREKIHQDKDIHIGSSLEEKGITLVITGTF